MSSTPKNFDNMSLAWIVAPEVIGTYEFVGGVAEYGNIQMVVSVSDGSKSKRC
jgi:hypothetical protein